jgi:hypothetical protein
MERDEAGLRMERNEAGFRMEQSSELPLTPPQL